MSTGNYPDLTKEDVRKYLLLDGNRCPYCGSNNIEAQTFDGEAGYQPVECNTCGNEWKDIYFLVGIETSDGVIILPEKE